MSNLSAQRSTAGAPAGVLGRGVRGARDRGASTVEWGGALLLVAGIVGVGATAVPSVLSAHTKAAVCRALGGTCAVEGGGAKARAAAAGRRGRGGAAPRAFAANAGPARAKAAAAKKKKKKLFLKFRAKKDCKVYPNYRKAGVTANRPFTIPKDAKLIWRYNVDNKWALVSYSGRSDEGKFPWWGFTDRGCIGNSVKQRDYPAGRPVPGNIKQGRSGVTKSGWRPVKFTIPGGRVVARKKLWHNATIRDDANFVIGNALDRWHVYVTNETRDSGWVKVYVPNAKRWGWIRAGALRKGKR